MSFDVTTLALAKSYTDQHGGSGGGASTTDNFIIEMTLAIEDDGNYTVASCDTTVEQIDVAVAAKKRVVVIASIDGLVFEMPILQGMQDNFYYFGVFLVGQIIVALAQKVGENKSEWQILTGLIQSGDVDYSNDALPNISSVEAALNKLIRESHSHANKNALDKLSVSNGKLQYNGSDVSLKPAYYIDLAGTYPNYTCPVAMNDIKAAYNAGYNLVCRCTLGVYTAILPLFIPMPADNTWIFSGSGALQSMGFVAQSFTVAITAGGVVAQNKELATSDGTLPNPYSLHITVGDAIYVYDGSERVDVVIDDGTEVSY